MAVVVPIIADVKGLLKGVDDSTKTLNRLSSNVGKAGASMSKNFTLPIVALGAASVVAFDQVDSAMDEVAQRTGATGKALDSIQGTFKEVAANATQGMDQVAIAVSGVAQRLHVTGTPLKDLSDRMLTFARVSNTDVETATTGVTKAMQALGVKAKDGAGFMDMLLKASQATGIKVSDLTAEVIKFGPSMSQLGLDTTSTVAIISQFEQSGLNSSAAMGGLKKALVTLAKSGETDLPKGLNEGIASIEHAKTASEATALAMKLFGAKAGPDLAVAIRSGKFSVDDLMKTLKGSKGTLDTTAAAVEGPQEKLARMKNQLTLVAASFADIFIPVLAKVLGPLQAFSGALGNLNPQMKEIVVVILAVVAAIGPMLVVVSKTISIFTQLMEIAKLLQVVVMALNITLLTNPFVLIAVAVIALIAALVILYKHSESFRAIVDEITGAVQTGLVMAFDWLKQKIAEITPTLSAVWSAIQPILSVIGQGIEIYVTTYIKLVKFYIEAWILIIQTAYEIMKPILLFIGGLIKDYIVAEVKAIKTGIDIAIEAFNLIKTTVTSVVDTVEGPIKRIGGFIKTGITSLVDDASSAISALYNTFKGVVDDIRGFWNSNVAGKGFTVPGWVPGVGGDSFKIPALASGGIVSSPTIAMIGEAGPEAVVPLSRGGMGGTTVNITVNAGMGADGSDIGRQIVEAIKVFERRNGPVFAGA
jgi:phage-related minor tail protein